MASSTSVSRTRSKPRLREDANVLELTERHPAGTNTSRGHLHRRPVSSVKATCVEVRLDQSVVAHDAQAIDMLQLSSNSLRALPVSPQVTRATRKQLCNRELTVRLLNFNFLKKSPSLAGPRTVDDACLSAAIWRPTTWETMNSAPHTSMGLTD